MTNGKSRAVTKSDASKTVIVKVRMQQTLVDQLDVAVAGGSRAELIRDLVAARLTPHPALAATQNVDRVARALVQHLDPSARTINRYDDDTERLEALGVKIIELTFAVRELNRTMAQHLLDAAGIGRRKP